MSTRPNPYGAWITTAFEKPGILRPTSTPSVYKVALKTSRFTGSGVIDDASVADVNKDPAVRVTAAGLLAPFLHPHRRFLGVVVSEGRYIRLSYLIGQEPRASTNISNSTCKLYAQNILEASSSA